MNHIPLEALYAGSSESSGGKRCSSQRLPRAAVGTPVAGRALQCFPFPAGRSGLITGAWRILGSRSHSQVSGCCYLFLCFITYRTRGLTCLKGGSSVHGRMAVPGEIPFRGPVNRHSINQLEGLTALHTPGLAGGPSGSSLPVSTSLSPPFPSPPSACCCCSQSGCCSGCQPVLWNAWAGHASPLSCFRTSSAN